MPKITHNLLGLEIYTRNCLFFSGNQYPSMIRTQLCGLVCAKERGRESLLTLGLNSTTICTVGYQWNALKSAGGLLKKTEVKNSIELVKVGGN